MSSKDQECDKNIIAELRIAGSGVLRMITGQQ